MTVFAELRMAPVASRAAGWDAPLAVRLSLAGAVLFVLLVGANLATPLYPLLQGRLGYGPLGTSFAFASYVLVLVGVLVTAGHWSDHVGRRAAMVLAVLLGLAGAAVFGSADTLLQLCAGRVLQGTAVGLATGACAAALRELLPKRPEWASRFTLLASSGGVAAGPAVGGALAELPGGTATPFWAHMALLAVLLVPLVVIRARPALLPPEAHPGAGRPVQLLAPRSLRGALPAGPARNVFWLGAAAGFLSFAVFGYQLAFSPALLSGMLGISSLPLTGAFAGITLASSALSQLMVPAAQTSRGRRVEVPAALVALGASLLTLAWAGKEGNAVVLIAASMAAGAAQGVAFRSLFNRVAGSVPAARHARTVSLLYVLTYLGSALPVLGLGALAGTMGLASASAVFLCACAGAAAALAAAAWKVGPDA